MSRDNAIARAGAIFDNGDFLDLLRRWISYPTESQNESCQDPLYAYLTGAITPYLENLGFAYLGSSGVRVRQSGGPRPCHSYQHLGPHACAFCGRLRSG